MNMPPYVDGVAVKIGDRLVAPHPDIAGSAVVFDVGSIIRDAVFEWLIGPADDDMPLTPMESVTWTVDVCHRPNGRAKQTGVYPHPAADLAVLGWVCDGCHRDVHHHRGPEHGDDCPVADLEEAAHDALVQRSARRNLTVNREIVLNVAADLLDDALPWTPDDRHAAARRLRSALEEP